MNLLAPFYPYIEFAHELQPLLAATRDGSHDINHVARVWGFARKIQLLEGGDPLILFIAAFLHDCVHVEKNHDDRCNASRLSSLRATDALRARDWPESRIAAISHAIEAHSFTGGIEPQTIEARILRDADRLDSTGVLGIARCFYVAGRIGSSLYDPIDPLALHRPVDDMAYALDHFGTRLLRASQEFHTATARRLAEQRLRCVADFHEHFLREVLDTPVISHFNGIDDFL